MIVALVAGLPVRANADDYEKEARKKLREQQREDQKRYEEWHREERKRKFEHEKRMAERARENRKRAHEERKRQEERAREEGKRQEERAREQRKRSNKKGRHAVSTRDRFQPQRIEIETHRTSFQRQKQEAPRSRDDGQSKEAFPQQWLAQDPASPQPSSSEVVQRRVQQQASSRNSQRRLQQKRQPAASRQPSLALPVEGATDLVVSPHAPEAGYIDINGLSSGTEIICPFTKKTLRVP